MTEPDPIGPRILVGACSFVDAEAALRLVEGLATEFNAGVGGVLVEDENILAVCEIPNQRVVLVSGATMLAPSRSQVRTLLEADARAFRRSLAQTAKAAGTNWIFEQGTGDLVATALKAAVGWDILVFGYRNVHTVRGKIAVLSGPEKTQQQMNETARLLSLKLSAAPIGFSVDPESTGADKTQVEGTSRFETFEAALSALARTNAQAVLVDLIHGPIRTPDDLARLLEVSRCPLIVFGASSAQSMVEHNTQIPPNPDQGGNKGGS